MPHPCRCSCRTCTDTPSEPEDIAPASPVQRVHANFIHHSHLPWFNCGFHWGQSMPWHSLMVCNSFNSLWHLLACRHLLTIHDQMLTFGIIHFCCNCGIISLLGTSLNYLILVDIPTFHTLSANDGGVISPGSLTCEGMPRNPPLTAFLIIC